MTRPRGAPPGAATASNTHPAMKHTPPSGVMAPRARTPDSAMAYSEPEKSTVPATNSHPATVPAVPGHRCATHAAATSASAWYIW